MTSSITATRVWTRLQNTTLPTLQLDDLNSLAGVMLRRKLVKLRIGSINAVLDEFGKRARYAEDLERYATLKAERDQLITHAVQLDARYDELDQANQFRLHRAFRTVVRKKLGDEVCDQWIAEAKEAMDRAQDRARNALVGSAVPTLGSAGGMKERKS